MLRTADSRLETMIPLSSFTAQGRNFLRPQVAWMTCKIGTWAPQKQFPGLCTPMVGVWFAGGRMEIVFFWLLPGPRVGCVPPSAGPAHFPSPSLGPFLLGSLELLTAKMTPDRLGLWPSLVSVPLSGRLPTSFPHFHESCLEGPLATF